jgi:hypothetical protein
MIVPFSNLPDSSISQTKDMFVADSLEISQQFCQDSLWEALQTSLFNAPPPSQTKETHFLLQEPAKPFEDKSYFSDGFDWFFIISLIFLVLLTFIRLNSNKILSPAFTTLAKGKFTESSYDSLHSPSKRLSFPLVICSWIGISFILYLFLFYCIRVGYLEIAETDKNLILKFSFIFIALCFFIRYIFFGLTSLLFDMKNMLSEYQYLLTRIDFLLVILTFPFVFIDAYYGITTFSQGELTWLVIAPVLIIFLILIVLIIYKIIRGWAIFRKRFHLYEYFLYLCTIEILPLLVFLKFAISTLQIG